MKDQSTLNFLFSKNLAFKFTLVLLLGAAWACGDSKGDKSSSAPDAPSSLTLELPPVPSISGSDAISSDENSF